MFEEQLRLIHRELQEMMRLGASSGDFEKILQMVPRKKTYGRLWTVDDVFEQSFILQDSAGIQESQRVKIPEKDADQILSNTLTCSYGDAITIPDLNDMIMDHMGRNGYKCSVCGSLKPELSKTKPCHACEIGIEKTILEGKEGL